MKLPSPMDSITLSPCEIDVLYPPLGFLPIQEHELGNGDSFGFYWPIGFEDSPPIVAETYHDEWSVQPHFSSLETFLTAIDDQGADEGEYIEPPDIEEDPRSPAACLKTARMLLKSQNVEDAIACLETAVSVLPEYRDAQALLSTQYRRLGQINLAIKAAVQAIISTVCFGDAHAPLVAWLSRQKECPQELENDPIWANRSKLTFKFGGEKENDQYLVLRDAIDCYLDNRAFIPAMTLMQTYGDLMTSETISFQQRNGFDRHNYFVWQREVAAEMYGKPRTIQPPPV